MSFYEPRCGTAVGYIGSRDPGAGEYSGGVRGAQVPLLCRMPEDKKFAAFQDGRKKIIFCLFMWYHTPECLIGRFSPNCRKVIGFPYATVYHGRS